MKFTVSVAMSDPSHYLPIAQAAEELGYSAVAVPDSIFFSDQVSAPYPYTEDGSRMWDGSTPWIEPFIAIPAMAAVTKKIKFYTNVLKLAVRNPLLVAKQVGSIAVLSNNRFSLGAGNGWMPEEFEWCGTEFKNRGARTDESLEILRMILKGGPVEFHGKRYNFNRLQMSPAPSAEVPFIIGGHTEPGLRRAAKYDGWTSAMIKEKDLIDIIGKLRAYRAELGRSNTPFEIQAVCMDAFGLDGYKRLEGHGVTDNIMLPWMMYGVAINGPLTDKIDGMKKFADDYVSKF